MIIMSVTSHPSGRYTLSRRIDGDSLSSDYGGSLLANPDNAAFFQAVAQELGRLQAQGISYRYLDGSET